MIGIGALPNYGMMSRRNGSKPSLGVCNVSKANPISDTQTARALLIGAPVPSPTKRPDRFYTDRGCRVESWIGGDGTEHVTLSKELPTSVS